ncbi:sugar transferase [Oceanicoccus sp. KOV_DT_Chl]|uniref:sugar transferase n=1 Tax=Oceanicoccus sp. KOV_DT_Chl TaxID=1904639 RepID=UPI000C7B3F92|nr:sugar transferase [Oceanicoccus sp. KOV_DT_Chl]
MNSPVLRLMELVLALSGLALSLPILLIVFLLGLFDTGSPLFFQQRVGKNQRLFTLIKFRTMALATASVATHQVDSSAVTRLGRFLRRTKLDELPQLINVLKGEMSLVGPRPCLPSQQQLIEERALRGVLLVRPGITGLAQVNGVDMSDPVRLAAIDQQMLDTLTLGAYFKYLLLTVLGRGAGDHIQGK